MPICMILKRRDNKMNKGGLLVVVVIFVIGLGLRAAVHGQMNPAMPCQEGNLVAMQNRIEKIQYVIEQHPQFKSNMQLVQQYQMAFGKLQSLMQQRHIQGCTKELIELNEFVTGLEANVGLSQEVNAQQMAVCEAKAQQLQHALSKVPKGDEKFQKSEKEIVNLAAQLGQAVQGKGPMAATQCLQIANQLEQILGQIVKFEKMG